MTAFTSWAQRIRMTALLVIFASLFVAGCATPSRTSVSKDPTSRQWNGRLALTVSGDQAQSFSAGFELSGSAQQGTLALNSPLGNTLAVLSWTPQRATLQTGRDIQQFASVDALIAHVTGTPVPAQALFDWLDGRNPRQAGWLADLSQLANGRLNARQLQGPQQADLRIVLAQ